MRLGLGKLSLTHVQQAGGGGGGEAPANALQLNGQTLQLNGQDLTLGA